MQNGKCYYYLSAGLVETDPEGALAGFDQVVTMEPEKAEW
jgi:COP9 signalosome complex subunit 2